MTYCTLQQLSDRYGPSMLVALTDRGAVATGAIDDAIVSRALADTDAMIDGYLAGRYVLPLAEVPALLTDLAQVIAIWKLHPSATDPKIKDDYEHALRSLREIGQGVIKLQVAGVETAGTGGSGARITDRARPFTETNMKGFI